MSAPNIVQAELFHKGVKSAVIRFSDYSGEFTKLAVVYQRHRARSSDMLKQLFASQGVKRWWYSGRYRSVSRKARTVKEKVVPLLEKRLAVATERRSVTAVEMSDYSFRNAQQHELEDVKSRAYACSDCWIFVFKPNDLCADKNVGVAYIM